MKFAPLGSPLKILTNDRSYKAVKITHTFTVLTKAALNNYT